ncbi:MAG TPA: YjgP/YjgQ family permease [Armatimonadetes bacterium]|nr:YjgP/YjgQ family permease [Armatimonadota bacterium]
MNHMPPVPQRVATSSAEAELPWTSPSLVRGGWFPFRPTRLDRYLLVELLGPFAFAMGIFTTMFMGADVLSDLVKLMARYHLSLSAVLELIGYRLLYVLGFTFPMSILLATLLCFGRLSNDREIVAMFASGLSFRRMLVPILGWSLFISLVTVALNQTVIPWAQQAEDRLKLRLAGELETVQSDIFFRAIISPKQQVTLLAKELDPQTQTMSEVQVSLFHRGQLTQLLYARQARWQGKAWEFYHGYLLIGLDQVAKEPLQLPFKISFGSEGFYMRWREAFAPLDRAFPALTQSPEDISLANIDPRHLSARDLRRLIAHKEALGADWRRDIAPLEIYLHNRFTLAFTSLIFALIGAPLGVRPQRGSTFSLAFGLSVGIIMLYYILWHTFSYLGQTGTLPPPLAAWTPNVVALGVGVFLALRVKM